MCNRASSWIICLAVALAFFGCKTTGKRESAQPTTSVSGVLKGGTAIVPTPQEIKDGYVPPANLSSSPSRMPASQGGLFGLTEKPTTTAGAVESIMLECYNR